MCSIRNSRTHPRRAASSRLRAQRAMKSHIRRSCWVRAFCGRTISTRSSSGTIQPPPTTCWAGNSFHVTRCLARGARARASCSSAGSLIPALRRSSTLLTDTLTTSGMVMYWRSKAGPSWARIPRASRSATGRGCLSASATESTSDMRNLILILVTLSLLAGCKSRPPRHPNEFLDPVTAAMVSSVNSPIIFARSHQDVAANSRQYVNVVATSINRQGRYEYILLVYVWSTVDARLGAGAHPGETLVFLADERAIRLQRDGRSLKEVGIAKPLLRPLHFHGAPRIYKTDRDTLKF